MSGLAAGQSSGSIGSGSGWVRSVGGFVGVIGATIVGAGEDRGEEGGVGG